MTDWAKALQPLTEKYSDGEHPLHYKNMYQLLIMILLAAQDSDAKVNEVTPALFKKYPDFKSLSKATAIELQQYLSKVRSFVKKSDWIVSIAEELKDKEFPLTMDGLVALKGIGRKSANIIMAEAGVEVEGIAVDLHVLRVVDRLGISHAKVGDKMEKEMMQVIPKKLWGEVGMALSRLGVDTCRPTDPKHDECILNRVCDYCNQHGKAD